MHKHSIAALAQGFRRGDYSSVELTQHYLERISQLDNQLNSFITVTKESALASAREADKAKADGSNDSHLLGIPIAHKDIFCTQGIRTSCGSKMLDNFTAPYDATVVSRFKEAGAICLGKTNMDEFAMGSSNETSYYGTVANPWNTACVPGGSSGGSAAAVAARLVPGATATDTGGSIRQPAAFCGVTGLKPTYGRVSRWGMIAFASSLDQGGPIAHSAEDCALLLNAMAGFDSKDSTSMDSPVPDFLAKLDESLEGIKIGLPKEFISDDVDPGVQLQIDEAIKQYERLGATIVDISLPHTSLSVPVYYVIAPAECSSNLSRFDGVRYGYRCSEPKDLTDLYERSRAEGFGDEVQRRILIGAYSLSSGYYDAYYLKAQKIRRLIQDDFVEAFKTVDVIMGPTSPTTAFKKEEKTNDPVSMYLADVFTISTNLAGLPGMSIPCGMSDDKPVGLHLIGNYLDEARLLNIAHQFQRATDWHIREPQGLVGEHTA